MTVMRRGSGFPYLDEVFKGFGFVIVESYLSWDGVCIKILLQPWADPDCSTELDSDNAVRLAMYDQAERAIVIAKNHFELTDINLRITSKTTASKYPLISEGYLELTVSVKAVKR